MRLKTSLFDWNPKSFQAVERRFLARLPIAQAVDAPGLIATSASPKGRSRKCEKRRSKTGKYVLCLVVRSGVLRKQSSAEGRVTSRPCFASRCRAEHLESW